MSAVQSILTGQEYLLIMCVHIDNNPIGQHPRVSTLTSGVFNNRLPKPRCTFVWDIETDNFKLLFQITR